MGSYFFGIIKLPQGHFECLIHFFFLIVYNWIYSTIISTAYIFMLLYSENWGWKGTAFKSPKRTFVSSEINFIPAVSQCTNWLNVKLKVCSSDSYYSTPKQRSIIILVMFLSYAGYLISIIPLCQLPHCFLLCPSSWAYLGEMAHYKVWFFLFRGAAVACQHKGIACLLPIWRSREWREEIVLTCPTDDEPGPWWEPTIGNLQMTVWSYYRQ